MFEVDRLERAGKEDKDRVYRVEARSVWEFTASLSLRSYPIVKRTACGVWIEEYHGKRRFINQNARKQWAYPTYAEALVGYVAKKSRQLQILQNQAKSAELLREEARRQLHGLLNLSK